MRTAIKIIGLLLVALTTACGGGGGSAGTTSGSSSTSSTTTTVVVTPTVTLSLFDSAGVATNSISAAGIVSAKATVKDATGKLVAGTKVTFAGDSTLIKISPASDVLTDSFGVATVQIGSTSLTSAGAGTLSATALIGTASVKGSFDFQISPANLTLTGLDLGTASGALAAFGNRPISVTANINGVVATGTPVQVSFLAGCGTISPATATTDGSGKASATYTASTVSCAGSNVKITATGIGVVAPVEGTIAVAAIQATNLQFVSANPVLIYLQNSGSTTQSLVTFKVVDASGNAVQNLKVNLALSNNALAAGLSIDTLGKTAEVAKTTDALGQVTVPVFSGNVPTSAQVVARLDAASGSPVIQTNSNVLTVASGKAVQKSASIALEKFSIEGLNIDGATSDVTMSFADRQGNPVPDGTEVNFVSESGVMIPARCVVAGGTSRCKSTFRSSGTRPADGRVSILAYLPGEKDFVDANFNNQYDLGEKFTDLGNAFRDDNEDGLFNVGEFSVPRAGSLACNVGSGDGTGSSGENGRPNTCDGVWGATEVRKQAIVVVASGDAVITSTSTTTISFKVSISDVNGNSMPTGTTIAVAKVTGNDACTVKSAIPSIVPNRYGPITVVAELDKCSSGVPASAGPPAVAAILTDRIGVTVTSPGGIITSKTFAVTPN